MPIPRTDPTRRLPPGDRRAALLGLLRTAGRPLGVGELAAAVGLHPNTVRAHLAVLVRSGSVTRSSVPAGRRGRPPELYVATPAPEPDSVTGAAGLAAVLAERLAEMAPDVRTESVRAGRAWADRLHEGADTGRRPDGPAARPLLAVLDRLGFAPEVAGDDVLLRACPFREVAAEHPEVVCSVHLGLVERILERTAPGVGASLRPFVEPALCVVGLRAGTAPVPAPRASPDQ